MEQENDGDTWNDPQRIATDGNQRKNRNHFYYSIFEIGKNMHKIPGNMRRLSVNQTLVKALQQRLM